MNTRTNNYITKATGKNKTSMREANNGAGSARSVALEPAFIALADKFGMVPERLAERIISAFAAAKPASLVIKARGHLVPNAR